MFQSRECKKCLYVDLANSINRQQNFVSCFPVDRANTVGLSHTYQTFQDYFLLCGSFLDRMSEVHCFERIPKTSNRLGCVSFWMAKRSTLWNILFIDRFSLSTHIGILKWNQSLTYKMVQIRLWSWCLEYLIALLWMDSFRSCSTDLHVLFILSFFFVVNFVASGWLAERDGNSGADKSLTLALLCQLSTIGEQRESAKKKKTGILDRCKLDGPISRNVINKPCFYPAQRMSLH